MIYKTDSKAIFYIKEYTAKNNKVLKYPSDRFCIIWNTGETAHFYIDHQLISLATNCVLFLTEINNLKFSKFSNIRVIQFNNTFYCNSNHEDDLGCAGLLLYNNINIPKIFLNENIRPAFTWIWKTIYLEMEKEESYKLSLLQNLLENLMIISTRLFKLQHIEFITDNVDIVIIKKYKYLVEKHFKEKTKVKEYANLLKIAPKSISNIFKKYIDRTPSQIIQERRLLEAIRMLHRTNLSIKEISNELNFKDVPTFSRFFKRRIGMPPSQFKLKTSIWNNDNTRGNLANKNN